EALGDLGGLLSFWSEYQWHYVQRKVPADQVQAQREKKKKKNSVCSSSDL
ncbi:jg952, partial [Pararge aegeria aegeria]